MKKFLKSFVFAGHGFLVAVRTQRNLRLHCIASMVVVGAGSYLSISVLEWCLVILAMGLVLTAELINSSIEGLVDLLEPNANPVAGKVKDIAAGGVLVAAVCAAAIGILVFLKYLAP